MTDRGTVPAIGQLFKAVTAALRGLTPSWVPRAGCLLLLSALSQVPSLYLYLTDRKTYMVISGGVISIHRKWRTS